MKLEPVPWIPFKATTFLDAIVQKDWKVFEWGSGGSTIYWGLHCGSVVSIEDDRLWYPKVVKALGEFQVTNADHRLIPGDSGILTVHPDPYYPTNYRHVRWDDKDHPFNYVKYATAIEAWEADTFDLIFIDGKSRAACFHHAIPKVKPGGWLLWDNSSHTPVIRFTHQLFDHWKRRDFHGKGPYIEEGWMATIWRKPL